ncbi:MAG: DUF2520 domain-containing protein [Gemmatimonadota bacterium]
MAIELLRAGWTDEVAMSGRGRFAHDHVLVGRDGLKLLDEGLRPVWSPSAILLTLPDAAVEATGRHLAPLAESPVPVLHMSGVLGSDVLSGFRDRGFPVGSVHPIASIADPVRDSPNLRDAWFGIEGMPEAVRFAERMVEALGGRSFPVDAAGKPLYHAAAVVASNYVVALLAVAERLMGESGVSPGQSREILTTLAERSVRNVASAGPVAALTGPIVRGDARTVDLHLERLSVADRQLYSVLAREALSLARAAGLGPEPAARLTDLLKREVP